VPESDFLRALAPLASRITPSPVFGRDHLLLFPEAVEDSSRPTFGSVPTLSLMGWILRAPGSSRVEAQATGMRLCPGDLFEAFIYGYLNRGSDRSSAGAGSPAHYRDQRLLPVPQSDFNTIAELPTATIGRSFRGVFPLVPLLFCRRLGLSCPRAAGGRRTRSRAVNNKDRNSPARRCARIRTGGRQR